MTVSPTHAAKAVLWANGVRLGRTFAPHQVARLAEWRAAIRSVQARYQAWHGGRAPDLLTPRRYTEKVQWRKLFDLNPAFAVLSDKAAARDFIAARAGADALVEALWIGADPADIPFSALRPPYVVKSTHACGDLVIVGRDETPDEATIRLIARAWLSRTYLPDEPAYAHIPPQLIVERQITTPEGERPIERRLFVFDGVVRVINTVVVEDGRIRNGAFHTRDGEPLGWHFTRAPLDVMPPRPDALARMIDLAEQIGAGFDHLRVDFYDPGDRVLVGEVTIYPWSGSVPFVPDAADEAFGQFWSVPRPRARAAWTVLTRRREIRHPAMAPS